MTVATVSSIVPLYHDARCTGPPYKMQQSKLVTGGSVVVELEVVF